MSSIQIGSVPRGQQEDSAQPQGKREVSPLIWLVLAVSAIAVVVIGWFLVHSADTIAEETSLGRVWVGSILLAGATSSPELMTNIHAGWQGTPDFVVGNVLGSNLCNMALLGIVDLSRWSGSVLAQVSPHHLFTASFASFLTAAFGAFVLLRLPYSIGGVGLDTLFLVVVFVSGSYLLQRLENHTNLGEAREVRAFSGDIRRLRKAVVTFLLAVIALFPSTFYFVHSAREVATLTGLNETFIGTTLLAITTSLPELASSLMAVRIGQYELAVGNMFGSNAFNMTLLFVGDLAYRKGSVLADANQTHLITAFFSIALMMVGAMGICFQGERVRWWQRLDGFLLLLLYFLTIFLLWHRGVPIG